MNVVLDRVEGEPQAAAPEMPGPQEEAFDAPIAAPVKDLRPAQPAP